MKNPGYDMTKVFEGVNTYQKRIVAFVDIMGMKDRMKEAVNPQRFYLSSEQMYVSGNQPFAEGKIESVMFSDCMYLVTEPKYINELICLLANYAYSLLVNRKTYIEMTPEGQTDEKIYWDCLKLRGGITYGEVLVLDEEAKKKNRTINSNMIIGPAVVAAYEMESTKAIYPRIITDNAFNSYLKKNHISYEQCYLVKDHKDDYYYLDFWKYMFKENQGPNDFLIGCIEYVKEELDKALESGNAKLAGQLLWYGRYLEKHIVN